MQPLALQQWQLETVSIDYTKTWYSFTDKWEKKARNNKVFTGFDVADRYYTLIVGANERRWRKVKKQLEVVADSLKILQIWQHNEQSNVTLYLYSHCGYKTLCRFQFSTTPVMFWFNNRDEISIKLALKRTAKYKWIQMYLQNRRLLFIFLPTHYTFST